MLVASSSISTRQLKNDRPLNASREKLRRDLFMFCLHELMNASHLLWHHRCGVIQAPISEAASDLRNLPDSLLHIECKLKVPLIVVRISLGSNRLEQQEPSRRRLAHIVHPTVDNRDANKERRGCCPLLLQGLGVLPPGRIQIVSVDSITERSKHLSR